jgi:hypothetical protein
MRCILLSVTDSGGEVKKIFWAAIMLRKAFFAEAVIVRAAYQVIAFVAELAVAGAVPALVAGDHRANGG